MHTTRAAKSLPTGFVEFGGVNIDDLYDLLETVWDGGEFSEADFVNLAVIQHAKQYARVRRLLERNDGGQSLWSRLQDASRCLEAEYPAHPTTAEIEDALDSSQPSSVNEVGETPQGGRRPVRSRRAAVGTLPRTIS
jgi:hypothetical protein